MRGLTMKTFRDVTIPLDAEHKKPFVEDIKKILNDGWIHDAEEEARLNEYGFGEYVCFACMAKEGRNAALLAFMYRDDNALYLTNIVPREKTQLSYDEYNFIAEKFYNRFVFPVTEKLRIKAELTSDNENMEDWISESSSGKLKLFSDVANKSTGSMHPLDQRRWLDFLITVHQEHKNLHGAQLKRWLLEVEHWPQDMAHNLTVEYEFAMDLLDFKEGLGQ